MTILTTSTGRTFDLARPNRDAVHLLDIAQALSHQGALNGQTRAFYSAAQHAVICSEMAEPEHRLAALLHEAASVYTGISSRQVKAMLGRTFRSYEERIERLIAERFGLPCLDPDPVRRLCDRFYVTEQRQLRNGPLEWDPLTYPPPPIEGRILPWSPELAFVEYLDRFRLLTGCDPAAFATWEPKR